MEFMLTLVSSRVPLSPAHIALTARFIDSQGITLTSDPKWLSPHKAIDIGLSQSLTLDQMKILREIHNEGGIDVFCTSVKDRRKKLVLADMDSTIVTSETLDEMAEEAGIKDKIAAITERAMRGELDFHDALRERVHLLKGLDEGCLKRTLDKTEISKGAEIFIQKMCDSGAFCALVSGGFTYFTEAIAGQVGFHKNHGNVLDIKDGKLTGHVQDPILDKDSKLDFLKSYAEEHDLDLKETLAIGDGANDLPMLLNAGLGIGYKPKPLVQDSLLNCIIHTDLKSTLYCQGFTDQEIVH